MTTLPGSEQDAPAPPRFPLLARALPLGLGVLFACLLIAWNRRPFRAFDTYFHLRFGEEFRHGWSIAHPGQPSGASSADWAPTQWLPQVGMSWMSDTAGRTGLVLVFAVITTGVIGSIYLLLRRRSGPTTAMLLTFVVTFGLLPVLSLRPQVLSYLFFVLVLAAWDRARTRGGVPWLLVPLGWLWAMCHGMWILGAGASGLLAVLLIVERRPSRADAVRLLLVPAGMLLASLLTPVGPRLFSAVALVNSRGKYFAEWGVPEILTFGSAALALLLAAAVLLMVRAQEVTVYDTGLLALGGVFAVYSGRTVPLAMITLALLVATHLPRRRRRQQVRRPELAVLGLIAVVVLAIAPTQTIVDDPADDVRPFTAQLDALPDGSLVVTDWQTGGILLWLEPRLDIPLHGYGDVYTDRELEEYVDLARLEPGWDRTLAELAPSAALLPRKEPLAYALEQDGWRPQHRARGLVLLLPPGP